MEFVEGVSETLLIPLYMRYKDAISEQPYLNDQSAVQMVEFMHYDFSKMDHSSLSYYGILARAKMMDDAVRSYLKQHPNAVVVSLGSGLDDRFARVDDGLVEWYDVDFSDVIEARKRFVAERNRVVMVASSILDVKWTEQVEATGKDMLVLAEGVLMYLTPAEMTRLGEILTMAFDSFTAHFDMVSPFAAWGSKYHDMVKRMSTPVRFYWGSRDGHKVVEMMPALRQVGLIEFTDEMQQFFTGWSRMFMVPFLYRTNNRLGIYKFQRLSSK